MRTPQLVAIDLDGTVVRHGDMHHASSLATTRALAAVRAKGVPVVVVTARSQWDSLRAVADLDLGGGPHVYAEGAIITGVDGGITHRVDMDPAEAIRGYLAGTPETSFSLEADGQGWLTCENFARSFESSWVGRADHDTLARTRTAAMGVRVPCDGTYAPTDPCPHAWEAATRANLDPAKYRAHIGRNGWTAIIAAGTDKSTGLAHVADGYGVAPEDVVAFGDSANDVSMLTWAGLGVAMGQSPAEVKEAADEVAPGVEDDGVAEVLRRLFHL